MCNSIRAILFLCLLVPAGGCLPEPPKKPALPPPPARGLDFIRVQHVLVKHTSPGRTPEEAKKLAYELFERAKGGEDFDAMMKKYSEDPGPGIYGMTNHGAPARPGESSRSGMVKGFGDTGFSLDVGEIGICDYHPTESGHGWHIIKRLE